MASRNALGSDGCPVNSRSVLLAMFEDELRTDWMVVWSWVRDEASVKRIYYNTSVGFVMKWKRKE